tara:strand:+ start:300 stop:557 length:258 start_codon:yes stop_codon:yes gene_type:complete
MKKLNYFQKVEVINMLKISSENYSEVIKNARNIYVAVNMLNDDLGDVVYIKVSKSNLIKAIKGDFYGIDFDKIQIDVLSKDIFVN